MRHENAPYEKDLLKQAFDGVDAEAKSTAIMFMHGRSQAVRLPKEFRFEGKEVRVSRVGDKVILEPIGEPAVRRRQG